MTSEQHNLFGQAPTVKAKAKSLPKVAPPSALPLLPSPLSPADTLKRAKNLASVRNARARQRIGDVEMSDEFCECGAQRIRELIDIRPHGGQTWIVHPCIDKSCGVK